MVKKLDAIQIYEIAESGNTGLSMFTFYHGKVCAVSLNRDLPKHFQGW